jgi:hypothetical protein
MIRSGPKIRFYMYHYLGNKNMKTHLLTLSAIGLLSVPMFAATDASAQQLVCKRLSPLPIICNGAGVPVQGVDPNFPPPQITGRAFWTYTPPPPGIADDGVNRVDFKYDIPQLRAIVSVQDRCSRDVPRNVWVHVLYGNHYDTLGVNSSIPSEYIFHTSSFSSTKAVPASVATTSSVDALANQNDVWTLVIREGNASNPNQPLWQRNAAVCKLPITAPVYIY